MSTITCLKELNEKGCLGYHDTVIFTVKEQIIEYKITFRYLLNQKNDLSTNDEIFNDEIFRILELDKNKMAEKAYNCKRNYNFKDNFWPETKTENYPSLTRLVKELYIIIEEREPKYTKYNRFEIMDI